MASQTVTSTPVRNAQPPPPAPTPPPGTWEHPKLAEISQRRVRDEFDERKLRILLISAISFLLSFYLPTLWPFTYLKSLDSFSRTTYLTILYFTRISIIYKGYSAIHPLFRLKDDMSDIALTPSQRALLGLGPASAPATPGSTYITPPRYLRSSSRNHSVSSSLAATVGSEGPDARSVGSLNGSGGGGSGSGSTSVFGRSTGVFDSPIAGSPLARKAMGQRASLGMGASIADVGSPSPAGQRNVGVGLSNKFLYQRRVASNGGMTSYI